MTSRTASTYTKGKNGEILFRPWTRRQMSPSCGELLKELMQSKTRGRERSYYLQLNLVLIVQAASHQDLSDSGDMEVFIDHPNTETWQGHPVGTSYRPISLLCPAAKVLESLILPIINKYHQLLETNTVLDQITRPPQLCCR